MRLTADITVWTVALETDAGADWRRLWPLLDASERERGVRFVFERHQRAHVVAHALKRLMLSAVTGAAPESWKFETGLAGKPRVHPEGRPRFNIAHSERLVACAVSGELEVGVDVEPIKRKPGFETAQAQFAETEQRWICSLPGSDQVDGFLRLWTLKEAFLKATGLGLAQPLHSFSFAFEPVRVCFHDPNLGNSRAWHFEQREINEHYLAVAWRKDLPRSSVEIREMRLQTLLTQQLGRGSVSTAQ